MMTVQRLEHEQTANVEQIPQEHWELFLQEFTEFNADMLTRLYLLGPAEPELLAEHQPLLDVTLDAEAGVPLILIECGDLADVEDMETSPATFRHSVRAPTTLWARKLEPAGWDALEIEGCDETVLLTVESSPTHGEPLERAREELIRAGRIGKAMS